MRLTRKQVKYGVAVFVSMSIFAVFSSSCSGDCKTAVEKDKLSALIGQVQGNCCVYEADPYGSCWQRAKPFFPGFKYRCVGDAAACLGEMRSQAKVAVPALIQALETGPNNYDTGDGPIPTRGEIIIALGKIGDPRAVKPLIAALNSPRPVDSGFFFRSSSKIGPKGYDGTIEALGLLGPAAREAVPHIIPFLNSSDRYHFEAASKALAQIKDTRAIPPLIEALSHPTYAKFAAEALGEFGPLADAAADILLEKLKQSPDALDSEIIASAIGKIRGETAIPKITYSHKQAELVKELGAIFNDYKLRGGFNISFVQGEQYSYVLTNNETLHVRPDRTRENSSLTSGKVWIEKDNKKIAEQKFSTFEEMQKIIKNFLQSPLQKNLD